MIYSQEVLKKFNTKMLVLLQSTTDMWVHSEIRTGHLLLG